MNELHDLYIEEPGGVLSFLIKKKQKSANSSSHNLSLFFVIIRHFGPKPMVSRSNGEFEYVLA